MFVCGFSPLQTAGQPADAWCSVSVQINSGLRVCKIYFPVHCAGEISIPQHYSLSGHCEDMGVYQRRTVVGRTAGKKNKKRYTGKNLQLYVCVH